MGMRTSGEGIHEEALGRIVGESVTSLAFRSRVDREVFVGDILVAEGDERNAGEGPDRFFLRVVNVHYGVEASGPDWMARTAGNMIEMDDRGIEHALHDRESRLFNLGRCVCLGVVRAGEFRRAKTMPPHFAPVRRAGPEDYAFLEPYMGDLEIGHLRSGDDVIPFAVGIDGARSIPYHIGVFATTGMGKSNLIKTFCASAISTGRYGVLIVDPHGEYHDGGAEGLKGLAHHPLAKRNLVVYSARNLKGTANKLTISAHEIEISDLKQLFEFTGPQADFLDSARQHYGPAWFAEVHERDESRLLAEVPGRFFEGTIAVVKRKVRRLFRNNLVHRDTAVTVTRPVLEALRAGKVVLVDSGGLLEAEELLVATVLARAVFEANKAAFGEPEFTRMPPVLVALEEAQRVLGKGGSGGQANVFAQIAREGRKFKTGICAVTQQPKLLDNEVVSQLNTLFILGLADKRDRDMLQDSAKQDVSALENEIQMLAPGEVLITSPYIPFAVPAKIHLYERYVEELQARHANDQPTGAREVLVKEDFY